MIYLVYNLYY